jgi:hypothetical protein
MKHYFKLAGLVLMILFSSKMNVLADNVALGKPTTVSDSKDDTTRGDKAVDGTINNYDSRWVSDGNKGVHWLEIDLAGSFSIGSVKIIYDLSNANEKQVKFSLEAYVNNTWTPVFEENNAPTSGFLTLSGGNGFYLRSFPEITTNKVRYVVPAWNSETDDNYIEGTVNIYKNNRVRMYEIEVYSTISTTLIDGETYYIKSEKIDGVGKRTTQLLTYDGNFLVFKDKTAEAAINDTDFQWEVTATTDNGYYIRNVGNGKYITFTGLSEPNGAYLADKDDAKSKIFLLEGVLLTIGNFSIKSYGIESAAYPNKVIDVYGNNQAQVGVWSWNGGAVTSRFFFLTQSVLSVFESITSSPPAVLVNQLGYDTGKSKRATVPTAPDDTPFEVVNVATSQVDFTGTVQNHIADFTALNPDVKTDYLIRSVGVESFPFTISKNWMQQITAAQALEFMDQSRQDAWEVGGSSGYAWRDGHQFSFELNGLALQYMANPGYYDRVANSIYKVGESEYPELRTQLPGEPDIVWLLKFGATRYYDWGTNKNIKLHILIKEQLAYFLYLYPEISQWVDRDFYERVRDFTIQVWNVSTCNKEFYPVSNTNHNLFALQTIFGGLKGSQPPGHSIAPNLMMYEVLRRDGLDGAQAYFDAAYNNCEWLLNNLDIADPRYDKGQRMSEHILIEGLTYFYEMYPDQAPAGLLPAIQHWAEKTVARSNNLWDIRMAVSQAAGDGEYKFKNGSFITADYWTGAAYAGADGQELIRNEPGNPAGLQSITYAASRSISDATIKARLKVVGIAAIDDMFGRNPAGRSFFYHVKRDFVGGDLGWFGYYPGGLGALGNVPGRIDGNSAEAAYPYFPANAAGGNEGWVAFNSAWNASIAYSAAEDVALDIPAFGAAGDAVTLRLKAPLNMDYTSVETGYIWIKDQQTDEYEKVILTEESADSDWFSADYTLPNTSAVTVSYGSGLFLQTADISITGTGFTIISTDRIAQCKLSQNIPNPVINQTEINYYVAPGVQQAYICVYDMQGRMLQKWNANVGHNRFVIDGSKLKAGIYLYSLIADGKKVDTKRMMLIK